MLRSVLLTVRSLLAGALALTIAGGAASAQSLPNGGSVTGAISFPFEQDSYTLTASVGETIRLTVADLDGGTLFPKISLYTPSGTLATSSSGALVGSLSHVAGAAGTFSVVVEDGNTNPDQTGNYEVHYVRAPGANEGGALPIGDSVTGFLSLGDLDSYTVDVNVGETVRLTVADLDGGSLFPWIGIYNPSGALSKSASGGLVGSISHVAGVSGTFTVVVRDGNTAPDETGNYELHCVRVPGANEGGLLSDGGSVTGSLSLGDLDSYTIDANVGETVRLTVADLDGGSLFPWIGIYNPSGALSKSASGALVGSVSHVAGVSGTFTVVVRDGNTAPDQTGNYELHSVRVPGANEDGPLPNGDSVTGFLTLGDLDSYTIDVNAGETVRLTVADLEGDTLFPWIGLYNPSGALSKSASGALVGSLSHVAGSSGTFTVVVRDGNTAPDEVGGYEVHVVKVPGADEGGPLPNGGSVVDKIDLGDLDSYTFDGVSGESVRLTVADLDGGTLFPWIGLYNPSGVLIDSSSGALVGAISRTLSATGTYTVVVRDGNTAPDETGNYEVHFVKMPGANEGGLLLDGVPVFDDVDLGDLDSYTFLASTGEMATITLTDTAGSTLFPFVALYGPSGNFITSASGTTTAVIAYTIQADGLHTLVVKDGNTAPDETGPYSLVVDGSGASSTANVICPPELSTDPILADVGGNPGVGPNVGNDSEPFNVSLDCTQASGPGIYGMVVWSDKQPFALPTQYGFFYLAGAQLLGMAGVHSQSIETWFPVPDGMVLPDDPTLIGVEITVQGFAGGYSPVGRLSSAIVQTIGS